jgi:hypothetical protein
MGIEIIDIPQGSEAWKMIKLGVPSSSRFDEILTSTGKQSTSAKGYMQDLAYERISGDPLVTYKNKHMQDGNDLEPLARADFEVLYGVEIRQIAFCFFDEKRLFGSSTDGMIDELDAVFEAKKANHRLQMERLETGWPSWKTDHYPQVQGEILCTGKPTCYLMSYCPKLKPVIIEVKRDEEYCDKLYKALYVFCKELDKVTERLMNR